MDEKRLVYFLPLIMLLSSVKEFGSFRGRRDPSHNFAKYTLRGFAGYTGFRTGCDSMGKNRYDQFMDVVRGDETPARNRRQRL